MEEQAPVFLKRTHNIGKKGLPDSAYPWYFTVFPLVENGNMLGFLCVENPRKHSSDAALFSTLIRIFSVNRIASVPYRFCR